MSGNDYNRASLIQVAKLYYLADLPQEKIAALMGVSRSKVSRMLSMARSMKIVEFKISESPLMGEKLGEKLKEHFGLNDVVVVPSEGNAEYTKRLVGKAAADYLNQSVLRDHLCIGVSWGTTVDAVIGQFVPARRVAGASVIQLSGGTQSPNFPLDSRDLTQALAQKLGAGCSLLHTPLVVSSPMVRDILVQEPEIAEHFEKFKRLDAAIVGIGSVRPERSVAYMAGYITREESEALTREGFATDICGNRISREGDIKPNLLSGRVVSIPPEVLRQVPMTIGVAVGEDKAASIIAAARGGFVKTLIIDEVAAILIMGMEGLQ